MIGVAAFQQACGYVGADLSVEMAAKGVGGEVSDSGGAASADGVGGETSLGGAAFDGTGGSGGDEQAGIGGEASGVGGDEQGAGGETASSTGGSEGTGGDASLEICPAGCEDYDGDFFITHTIGVFNPEKISTSGSGAFEFDQTIFQRAGDNSLKLTTQLSGDEVEVENTIPLLTEGQLHFRAWILAPEGSMSDWVKVVGLNGPENDGPQVRIDSEGRLVIHLPNSGELWKSEVASFPRGDWFCLQILVDLGNIEGSIEIRINGATVLLVDGVDTKPDTGVRVLVYGIAEIGPGPSENLLYFDRVRAGYGEPPCDESSGGGGSGGADIGRPGGT